MIRTIQILQCPICGHNGNLFLKDLEDTLYNAEGVWSYRKCTNHSCELVWIDPKPLQDDLHNAYEQYYTHSRPDRSNLLFRLYDIVASCTHACHLGYKSSYNKLMTNVLSKVAWLLPGGPDEVLGRVMFLPAPTAENNALLEIGCGSGMLLTRMRELGWNCQGVEPDSHAVSICRDNGLDVLQGTIVDCRFDSQFDAVVMSHVFEHVYDVDEILAFCKNHLRPGGTLILTTPNIDGLGFKLFGKFWRGLEPPRHLHLFSPKSAGYAFSKHEFSNIRIKTSALNARSIYRMSRLLKRKGMTRRALLNEQVSLFQRYVPGILFQYMERILLTRKSDKGDLLIAIATKLA